MKGEVCGSSRGRLFDQSEPPLRLLRRNSAARNEIISCLFRSLFNVVVVLFEKVLLVELRLELNQYWQLKG